MTDDEKTLSTIFDLLKTIEPLSEETRKAIAERVAQGEPMFSGECPKCGALCHEQTTAISGKVSVYFESEDLFNAVKDGQQKLNLEMESIWESAMTDEISKMLTLSTAHVTKETADLLKYENFRATYYYMKAEFGWFINVADEKDLTTCPDDLKCLLAYARDLGCRWLCLDRDGDVNPNLPTWEW